MTETAKPATGRFSGKFKAVKSFAEPPAPLPFDREKAYQLVSDAVSMVSSIYPAPDCLDWLQANRPDVRSSCREAEAAIDIVALGEAEAEDLEFLKQYSSKVHALAVAGKFDQALVQGLEIFTGRYAKAFELFAARPPVIEMQETFTM